MKRRILLPLALLLAACASKRGARESGALSPAPEPPELAALDVLTGTWDGVTRATILETGEEFEVRGLRNVHWEAGGQFLFERGVSSVPGLEPTTSLAVWTWDDAAARYRCWRFDSHGTVHERTMNWNEAAGLWYLEMDSRERGAAESVHSHGTMRFLSPTEKETQWQRFRPGEDEPWIVLNGTSKRIESDR